MKRIVIDPATADVLRAATVDGNMLTLPGQLERAQYVAVNKALVGLGGKWDRRASAHVFDGPVAEKLAAALDDGSVVPPSAFGYFPTPAPLVDRLLHLADVRSDHDVLEPSAGRGAIADRLAAIVPAERLYLVELQAENCAVLVQKHSNVLQADFLDCGLHGPQFDRIAMNPPFERQQDIEHVTYAFGLLRPGGRLVSVMAAGVLFRNDARTRAFRELVDANGVMEENPEGSFKESGTSVRTVTVTLNCRFGAS